MSLHSLGAGWLAYICSAPNSTEALAKSAELIKIVDELDKVAGRARERIFNGPLAFFSADPSFRPNTTLAPLYIDGRLNMFRQMLLREGLYNHLDPAPFTLLHDVLSVIILGSRHSAAPIRAIPALTPLFDVLPVVQDRVDEFLWKECSKEKS